MPQLFRILVGLLGAASLAIALNLWFNVAAGATSLGIAAESLIGRATVRADVAGLFSGIGALALIAAWRQDRVLIGAAMLVTAAALLGRIISVALDGSTPASWPPIIVEIVSLAILFGARHFWAQSRKTPEGL